MTKTFKYFGFGSNLLQSRLHRSCPGAVRVSPGCLKKYRLDFDFLSKRWGGYVANIFPDENSEVWGAVWDIPESEKPNLDKQEGIMNNVYKPISVEIVLRSGEKISCRCYELCSVHSSTRQYEYLPSKIYLDTMIRGAIESDLPPDYIEKLKKIPHNDFNGPVQFQID